MRHIRVSVLLTPTNIPSFQSSKRSLNCWFRRFVFSTVCCVRWFLGRRRVCLPSIVASMGRRRCLSHPAAAWRNRVVATIGANSEELPVNRPFSVGCDVKACERLCFGVPPHRKHEMHASISLPSPPPIYVCFLFAEPRGCRCQLGLLLETGSPEYIVPRRAQTACGTLAIYRPTPPVTRARATIHVVWRHRANTCRCYKWEQGEIPEAHARFLGLRDDGLEALSARKKQRQAEASSGQAMERALYTAGGLSPSLRGGEEEEGEQGDRFITYWSEKGPDRPVKWVFFNDAYFQVGMRCVGPGRGGVGR